MENVVSGERYRILSVGFVKAYVVTMRPYLLFISGITGIAGMSFAPEIQPGRSILLFLGAFLSYGFGQALTDCFQIDTDSLSAPYRPLTKGIVRKSHVLLVSVCGLLFCISVFAYSAPLNLFFGMLAGGGLATYTFFKRRWWGGPWYNAWIVAVLCGMAFLAGSSGAAREYPASFLWTLGVVFFGYANFVLSGYFKDIDADAATGYNTLPVVFGRKTGAAMSSVLAILSILSAALAMDHIPLAAGILVTGGVSCTAIAQILLHRVRTDEDAHPAISLVVHGYVLLLAGIAVSQKPDWSLSLFIYYAAFAYVLSVRPAKNQI